MKSIWQQFSFRERSVVLVGLAIIAIALLYEFLWLPLQAEVQTLRQSVQEKQQAALIMQRLPPQNLSQNNQSSPIKIQSISTDQLLGSVQQSLAQANLETFVREVRQEQRNQLTVQFSAVGFENLLNWLVMIWQTYHIKVQTLTLSPTENSGEVKATLMLSL